MSATDWTARVAHCLTLPRPYPWEDETDLRAASAGFRDAAVLVALTRRSQPGVILTQRPQWLRQHPGQVAFPGGKVDPHDSDVVATALREAEEELGLSPRDVTVIGTADAYHSGSGFRIVPVLATVDPDVSLSPNPDEVESWFEVPMQTLFDVSAYQRVSALWQGAQRHYYDRVWNDRRIWGVTAGIIINLARRLEAAGVVGAAA